MPTYIYKSAVDLYFEKKIVASTGISLSSVKLTPQKQIDVTTPDPLKGEQKADLDQFMLDNDYVFDSEV